MWVVIFAILLKLTGLYATNGYVAQALQICTHKRKAEAEGLPHLPLDTVEGLWKWFELRQLFVKERFPMQYALGGPVVATITAIIMLYLSGLALLAFVWHADLLTPRWHISVTVAVLIVIVEVHALTAVGSVYLQQQQHLHALNDAGSAAIVARAKSEAPSPVPDPLLALLEDLKKRIFNEPDSPRVVGIPVKPPFLYVVMGYIGTAGIAFVAKAIMNNMEI